MTSAIEMKGFDPSDWYDAYGHRWVWVPARRWWRHDRPACHLDSGKPCEPR